MHRRSSRARINDADDTGISIMLGPIDDTPPAETFVADDLEPASLPHDRDDKHAASEDGLPSRPCVGG